MKFSIGDKVGFLDEKGGGIVTKIIDENIVHVEIEDGFEIPVAVKNLIRISTSNQRFEPSQENYSSSEIDNDYYSEDNISPIYLTPYKNDMPEEGIYFAIVPENQDNPLAGNLILYLINYSHYQVLYSIFTNESGLFHGFDFGYLEPNSKVNLDTIDRTKIELWVNSLLQVVFFKEGKTDLLKPISRLINFKPVKTYKEDAFRFDNMLRKKALVMNLEQIKNLITNPYFSDSLSVENIELLKEKLTSESKIKSVSPKKESFFEKHKIDDKIAEADLHINQLIDNFTNLDNRDLINIQLDYFKKCMDQAEKEKLSKIIFIHGVGDGVLKKEITKQLEKTDGIQYYDASYSRYGIGATEVFFYRNK